MLRRRTDCDIRRHSCPNALINLALQCNLKATLQFIHTFGLGTDIELQALRNPEVTLFDDHDAHGSRLFHCPVSLVDFISNV